MYKFQLEPYKPGGRNRFSCPDCGQHREFTRYIDTETKEYIHASVGRCNREKDCGYHLKPKEYFSENGITPPKPCFNPNQATPPIQRKKTLYIPQEEYVESLKRKTPNNFIDFLLTKFKNNQVKVRAAIEKYRIGTVSYPLGGTIFWQIDTNNRIRTGKIMMYNPATGKRCKKKKGEHEYFNWVHSILKITDGTLRQVYFGTHLLPHNPNKPVALVESEKTAVLASMYFPNYIWLATGGLQHINKEKNKALKDRNVILVPDANCIENWNTKLPLFQMSKSIRITNIIETLTNPEEKKEGLDLADLILRDMEYPGAK